MKIREINYELEGKKLNFSQQLKGAIAQRSTRKSCEKWPKRADVHANALAKNAKQSKEQAGSSGSRHFETSTPKRSRIDNSNRRSRTDTYNAISNSSGESSEDEK